MIDDPNKRKSGCMVAFHVLGLTVLGAWAALTVLRSALDV